MCQIRICLTVNPDGNCSASTLLKITTQSKAHCKTKRHEEMCKWREETKEKEKLSLGGRGLVCCTTTHHAEDEHLIERLIIDDKQHNSKPARATNYRKPICMSEVISSWLIDRANQISQQSVKLKKQNVKTKSLKSFSRILLSWNFPLLGAFFPREFRLKSLEKCDED